MKRLLEFLRKAISFCWKKATDKKEVPDRFPKEYAGVLSFNQALRELLSKDQYIARSDYRHLIETLQSCINFMRRCVSPDYWKTMCENTGWMRWKSSVSVTFTEAWST